MVPESPKGNAPAVGYREWDGSRDERDQPSAPRHYRSSPRARWDARWDPGRDSDPGPARDDGAAAAGRAHEPETGRWSTRHNRWVPYQRTNDDTDFAIGRFEDTGDVTGERERPGQGRVLDHDDWYEATQAYHPPPPYGQPFGQYQPYGEYGRNGHGGGDPGGRAALEPRRPGDVYYSGRRYQQARRTRAIGRDDSLDDPENRNYLASMLATLAWYALPLLAYLGWAVMLSGEPPGDCLDALGAPCVAPRMEALGNLGNSVPQVCVAMALSIVVAMLLRWATVGWRALTVGFAAAVVGAGTTTVVFSVLTA